MSKADRLEFSQTLQIAFLEKKVSLINAVACAETEEEFQTLLRQLGVANSQPTFQPLHPQQSNYWAGMAPPQNFRSPSMSASDMFNQNTSQDSHLAVTFTPLETFLGDLGGIAILLAKPMTSGFRAVEPAYFVVSRAETLASIHLITLELASSICDTATRCGLVPLGIAAVGECASFVASVRNKKRRQPDDHVEGATNRPCVKSVTDDLEEYLAKAPETTNA